MYLTPAERETLIRFDDSEDTATFYTCNPVWIRKLNKLVSESTEITVETEDKYSKTYIFPKKWLRVQKSRLMTEKEKAKRREIALNMLANRKQRKELNQCQD